MTANPARLRQPWFWLWLVIAALLTLFAVYWAAYQGTGSGIPGGWASDDVRLRLAGVRFATVVATVPLAVAIGVNGAPALATRRGGLWIAGLAAAVGAGAGIALLAIGAPMFPLGIGAGLSRALLIGAMGVGSVAAAQSAGTRRGVRRTLGYVVAAAAALVCGFHLVLIAISSLSPTI